MKVLQSIICILLIYTFSVNQADAQKTEFSNLKRYSEANKNLPEPTVDEDRVVFLGNSITDSWSTDFFEKNKSYINRIVSVYCF